MAAFEPVADQLQLIGKQPAASDGQCLVVLVGGAGSHRSVEQRPQTLRMVLHPGHALLVECRRAVSAHIRGHGTCQRLDPSDIGRSGWRRCLDHSVSRPLAGPEINPVRASLSLGTISAIWQNAIARSSVQDGRVRMEPQGGLVCLGIPTFHKWRSGVGLRVFGRSRALSRCLRVDHFAPACDQS